MNLTQITNKNQIHQIIKTYALRHRQGQLFTLDDLHMHLPNYNKTKLHWDLDDACLMGCLRKKGEVGYYGNDQRTLKEKILSLFGNEHVAYTSTELQVMFKVRPQDVVDAIIELVAENKLEQHPFMGSYYWLVIPTDDTDQATN